MLPFKLNLREFSSASPPPKGSECLVMGLPLDTHYPTSPSISASSQVAIFSSAFCLAGPESVLPLGPFIQTHHPPSENSTSVLWGHQTLDGVASISFFFFFFCPPVAYWVSRPGSDSSHRFGPPPHCHKTTRGPYFTVLAGDPTYVWHCRDLPILLCHSGNSTASISQAS